MATPEDYELYEQIAEDLNAVFDKYITGHDVPLVAAVGILVDVALAPLIRKLVEEILASREGSDSEDE